MQGPALDEAPGQATAQVNGIRFTSTRLPKRHRCATAGRRREARGTSQSRTGSMASLRPNPPERPQVPMVWASSSAPSRLLGLASNGDRR
jgi:hypothetical protein